ncbi:polysaccharide deacetylase family protein [Rhodoplanes sp. Z2-YC6860]|uniref:polysaccharide deacetylase family protein n=1 Tax=Rhodoplanes sp. Z2-YC6860 TaxID=674703 RepID=UPI00078DF90A|nr:polysaccharide deacetylase family protein [Rhodoplanes sp. Z2-YC6860]AMN43054.1 polysaccharide deacetylase [Rhodoplanes sp. Z2-YC6860]
MKIRRPRLSVVNRLGLASLAIAAALAGFQTVANAEPQAATCPGHPDAIGTSRTLVVDPTVHRKIGTMSYPETLPLADHEVVLTFDDGPLAPYTNRILDILDAECVKATYFIVGTMAKSSPKLLQQVAERGHTIGTHSMGHPIKFRRLSAEAGIAQLDDGIAATAAALGDAGKLAPFFRFPGFGSTEAVETRAAAEGIMIWGADMPADDWRRISAKEVAKRAISRIEAKGKGVLLLHDIHQRTVEALPLILKELKERGYRIVHVVPSSAERPATPTVASDWKMRPEREAKQHVATLPKNVMTDVSGSSPDKAKDKSANSGASKKSRRHGRHFGKSERHRVAHGHHQNRHQAFRDSRTPWDRQASR